MWSSGRKLAVVLILLVGVGIGATLLWGMRLAREAGTPAATRPQDGRSLYEAHCAVCHGSAGKGDGPGAKVIRQTLPDFSDAAAMQKVNDRFFFDIIKKGSSQFGRSNAMPAWGMKLSDEEIRAVVAYLRSLASRNPAVSSGRKDTP